MSVKFFFIQWFDQKNALELSEKLLNFELGSGEILHFFSSMLKTEHNYIDADFRSRLESMCRGLVLVSETDSDVVPIFGSIPNSDEAEELLESVGMKVGTPITTVGFEDFFERLSKQHDWFTNEQVENARGFRALKLVFDNELKKIKVFKIGKNNLQIVVIGQDRNGFAVGVTMHAIET